MKPASEAFNYTSRLTDVNCRITNPFDPPDQWALIINFSINLIKQRFHS